MATAKKKRPVAKKASKPSPAKASSSKAKVLNVERSRTNVLLVIWVGLILVFFGLVAYKY